MTKSKTIKVDYLARVEGEGALYVRYDDAGVHDVKLKIFEPPRFFEGFMRGRDYLEAPDITARICGICPIAYQMSAVHAMEDALGLSLPAELQALRRLIYCGEWIESHTLHIYMLHAPDFLGYTGAVAMAKDHPTLVQDGLNIKKAGNAIVSLLGGREVHPINVRVGGFYRVPTRNELQPLREQLLCARDMAMATVRWAASLPFPKFERAQSEQYEFVALSDAGEYPMNRGSIVSTRGLAIPVREYDQHFREEHIEYSSALHSTLVGRGAYFVGPMARYNLNFDRLSPLVRQLADDVGFAPFCANPFQSIVVRSLEVLYAFDEALRLIDNYRKPDIACVPTAPRAGTGFAATEAPRGLLYHRYSIDDAGKITEAKIVAPTSQNQKTIEDDLRLMLPKFMHLPEKNLQAQCEQAIRNYDPCISCSTHFLQLHLDKAGSGNTAGRIDPGEHNVERGA
ncbi:Ni/Fe hydrogenase subunit alpha [Microbulbifer harenosus]|uniref:Ni/Fe hydrogenase subunit alpha n=1 Tax=Microbulbifer harenosus TaxID=2576840 RepID=A0ABY2UFR1_9GAMM|nr:MULTISPECIES: Ni/Fe hydrogenase subunit alpha [Microbulbifer]QIL89208.1 Ni/Fe hydrogenase subunit alpha [Microbulbifer sp. SH-1]TLM76437.1 Ni/Fe hydrogenase subunit alpha [Microbulbifer harenosus]